jgi:hypothetical protein
MSTIRVDNFGPSAGGTTYSARFLVFLDNKYTRWYMEMIDRALSENRRKGKGVYYERHHIIPKFMGGEDVGNTVLLTGKEHFVAHLLLTKMVEPTHKNSACFALARMAYQEGGQQTRYTARSYSVVRKLVAEAFSEIKKGSVSWNRGLTMETSESVRLGIEKMRETKKSNPQHFSDETRRKISEKSRLPRKPLTDEHKSLLSSIKTGKPLGPKPDHVKNKIKGVEYYDPETGITKRFKTHMGEVVPAGWVKGRYLKNKYIWATDGSSNMRCIESEMPEGFYRGRTVERRT